MKNHTFKVRNQMGTWVPAPEFPGWVAIGLREKLLPGDVYIEPFGSSCYTTPLEPKTSIQNVILALGGSAWSAGFRCSRWMVYRRAPITYYDQKKKQCVPVPSIPGYDPIPHDEPTKPGNSFVWVGNDTNTSDKVILSNIGKSLIQIIGGGAKFNQYAIYRPKNSDHTIEKKRAWARQTAGYYILKIGDVLIRNSQSSSINAEYLYKAWIDGVKDHHIDGFIVNGFSGKTLKEVIGKYAAYSSYHLWSVVGEIAAGDEEPSTFRLPGNPIYSKELTIP